jgi:uncharacterized protein GlcG (DUF336 family)
MAVLSLELAQRIIESIRRRTVAAGCNPLAIVVIDEFGDLVILDREDEARDRARAGQFGEWVPAHIAALASHFGGPICVGTSAVTEFLGGILIRGEDGRVLGALGLSGDLGGAEAAYAAAGIEDAGFIADIGVPVH